MNHHFRFLIAPHETAPMYVLYESVTKNAEYIQLPGLYVLVDTALAEVAKIDPTCVVLVGQRPISVWDEEDINT